MQSIGPGGFERKCRLASDSIAERYSATPAGLLQLPLIASVLGSMLLRVSSRGAARASPQ
jgi:hypothetical protein